jgi:membrane protease YdiL (CAAX protease family)
MSSIESAAGKVALAAAVVAIVLFRSRDLPREELGLVKPPLGLSLLFVAVYLSWMLATDAAIHWRGPLDWGPWLAAPLIASIMRVLAVALIGPTAEELIFRGWFFALLQRRVATPITIAITAIGWALLHFSYGPRVVGVIIVDGILLGLARWKTKSVFTPIAMHALYNLYSIW